MLTRRQCTTYPFSPAQDKSHRKNTYENLPLFTAVKDDDYPADDDEPLKVSDVEALSDVATELMKLYPLLDNKHHIFTWTAFVLERLFTVLHMSVYGEHLDKHHFISEVVRLARTEEATYAPVKMMPKGSLFEPKPMTDGSVTSLSVPISASLSAEPYRYGQ